MNTNQLKALAVVSVIFGSGMGTGYFVCKRKMVKRYQQDLIDVKQFYYDKIEELGVMPRDFQPEVLVEGEEPEQYEETEEDDTAAAYNEKVLRYSGALRRDTESKGTPIIKYNKPPLVMKDYGDLEEPEDPELDAMIDEEYEAELERRADEFAKTKEENRMNGKPYVINHTEYEEGPEDYEKLVLYYYSEDRTLCEDDDSEVEDEEGAMGFDYEDVLDMQTTAWVRNDVLMNLYEIHRLDGSYKLEVLGAMETPREREFRIMGRRKQALDK